MELKEDLKGWQVVLASASPRRKELLEQIGICPQICPSSAEEKKDETDPQKLVEKLSSVKAEDVAGCFPAGTLVIGADTVVSIVKDGESDPVILGKPGTVEKAEEMISLIQGRTHQVYTGVTVILCLERTGLQKLLLQKRRMWKSMRWQKMRSGHMPQAGNLLTRQVPMGSRDPLQLISRGSKEITAM